MDLYKLIRVADAFQLGDRLFQKRLSDYAKVDGWTDAALLVAEAAVPGPLRLILKTRLQTNETPSAQLGVDDQPVRAPTLALAILGAVLQHKLKELDAE
jgi:tRNA A37 threonylcarbamoyladenosine synthetase subunit TsaC/SUA5/YrdC